ncbi:MAG: AMP-binding protein [Myxococcales bacterium]|nr:AMP-binding protein [Myxococcales bacterium]
MPNQSPLQWALAWEQRARDHRIATQPIGGGAVEVFTWGRVLDQARRIASYLASLELEPRSRVALASKNTIWWIAADLAIWMAGHISVPVYPTLARSSVRKILEHSGARAVFMGKLDDPAEIRAGVDDSLPRIRMPLAVAQHGDVLWSDLLERFPRLEAVASWDLDECATIIYTSGSTGNPKGAMHSFRAMAAAAEGVFELYPVGQDDRVLSYLPLAHVYERVLVEMGVLHTGAELFFAESLETFLEDLRRARPTLFASVPRLWQKFHGGVAAKLPSEKLARLLRVPVVRDVVRKRVLNGLGLGYCKIAASASAPIPSTLIAWYRSLGLELAEGYGMTENFGYSHGTRPGRGRPDYVGEPYRGVEHRIAADGEVQVKSPATMLGYYNEPELTRQSFTDDGWLKTGDRGEIDELGRLRITGRVKELFKTSKGKYVAPVPIENRLLQQDTIESVCVTGEGQGQPYALVVLNEAARKDPSRRGELEATLATHLQWVNSQLDPHEQLEFIVLVAEPWSIENGLLTPTMKIRRGPIEARYAERVEEFYRQKKRVFWE